MTNSIPFEPSLRVEEVSILEDSRHFVNRSIEALNLQMKRLETNTTSNADDFWDYLADAHFYIVALKRLRQALLVSKKVRKVWDNFKTDFAAFDAGIKDAIQMRHVLEHIDEYIRNSGANRNIKNSDLYGNYFDEYGCLHWAGLKFDRHRLQGSAEIVVRKYRDLTSHEFKLYREKKTGAAR